MRSAETDVSGVTLEPLRFARITPVVALEGDVPSLGRMRRLPKWTGGNSRPGHAECATLADGGSPRRKRSRLVVAPGCVPRSSRGRRDGFRAFGACSTGCHEMRESKICACRGRTCGRRLRVSSGGPGAWNHSPALPRYERQSAVRNPNVPPTPTGSSVCSAASGRCDSSVGESAPVLPSGSAT